MGKLGQKIEHDTLLKKVLKNVIEDMESEMYIFENEGNKTKGFYSDYSNISYGLYLNSVPRLKKVLKNLEM